MGIIEGIIFATVSLGQQLRSCDEGEDPCKNFYMYLCSYFYCLHIRMPWEEKRSQKRKNLVQQLQATRAHQTSPTQATNTLPLKAAFNISSLVHSKTILQM